MSDRFFARLESLPGPSAIIARLTPQEAVRLRASQAAHFRQMMEPVLDAETALDSATAIGRVHSLVGVEIDWFASAFADYEEGILDLLRRPERGVAARAALKSVVHQRVSHELRGALGGYRQVLAGQAHATGRVSHAAGEAETLADLLRGVLDALGSMDGIAAVLFGRPDETGRFQFEVGAGEGIEALVAGDAEGLFAPMTTARADATGRGPTGRAWRTQQIERTDSYMTDPSTEPWRALGARCGWRSSAAVPLLDVAGRSRAILNLYSAWPGFFSYSNRVTFLNELRQLMEPALARLETRHGGGSAVKPFASRRASLAMLEGGDVEMLFQPIVTLADGRLLKLEALARLRDGDHLVSPAEFLPALGERELLRLFEIGLDQGLGAMAAWEEAGVVVGVSVNLPATCLSDRRYVACVERALAARGAAPQRLTLELLETGDAGSEPRWDARILTGMKALGVRLAEDDLGAGHSSLLRMQELAFDEVKIDQQLVRGTASSPREDLSFIHPLTSLARSLGLSVIVEGLETPGLIEAAVVLGADAGQGYGIARPMPAAAVPEWARGFRLDVEPERPRTALGAIAAHLAWEHRLAAVSSSAFLLEQAAGDSCRLSAYLEAAGARSGEIERAHLAVHAAAIEDRGGPVHRDAWQRLVALLRRDAN